MEAQPEVSFPLFNMTHPETVLLKGRVYPGGETGLNPCITVTSPWHFGGEMSTAETILQAKTGFAISFAYL